MANFFSSSPDVTETTGTPSPASQAQQKLKMEMLARFLNSMAGTAPSFASFAAGGPAQRQFPGGFGPDIASVLNVMNQPGAFTSTGTKTESGGGQSQFADLSQLLGLSYLISQATGINPLQMLLKGVGGGAGTPSDPTAPSSGFLGSLPSGDQPGINFTPAPTQGMTFDPTAGMTVDPTQGMSTLTPDQISLLDTLLSSGG